MKTYMIAGSVQAKVGSLRLLTVRLRSELLPQIGEISVF